MLSAHLSRRQFHLTTIGTLTAGQIGTATALLAGPQRTARASLPRASDTIISPRTPNPAALPLIDAFRPTRAEWHYVNSVEFVQAMRAHGIGYISGAINTLDVPGADISLGLNGLPNSAPWIRAKNALIRSNSPRTLEALIASIQRNLDAGVDGIVFDDPLPLAFSETLGGGDFSPETQAGFDTWLRSLGGSYGREAEQRRSRGETFRQYLASAGINNMAGYMQRRQSDPTLIAWRNYLLDQDIAQLRSLRSYSFKGNVHPLLAGNLNTPRPSEKAEKMISQVDYFTSEINSDRLVDVAIAASMLTARGKPLVASPRAVSNDTRILQHAVVSGFVMGAIPLIPWDVYAPPDKRYYCQPSDFVPIFDFFRKNVALVEAYQIRPRLGIAASVGQTSLRDFNAVAESCLRWGIPFRVVTCGGEMGDRAIRAADLEGLTAVVDPAMAGSLSSANRQVVAANELPLLKGAGELAPYAGAYFEAAELGWSAIERRSARGERILFLIPRDFGAAPIPAGTRLTISDPSSAGSGGPSLLTLDGRRPIEQAFEGGRHSLILPKIDLFGSIIF